MEKQKLGLIIAIIILIGIITILSGYIIGLNQNSIENANNTTNNTTVANNTTVTKNTATSYNNEETNYIGEAAAKQIAIDVLTEYGVMDTAEIRSIDLVTINGVPLYRIKFWDHSVLDDGTEHGWDEVLVGAKDGKIYDDYGERVTT